MKRPTTRLAFALLLLAAAMGLKGELLSLPNVPDIAAPGAFDTKRAMARLQRILGDQRPHPVDSTANDGVRDRLVAELRAAGLAPRISDAMACNSKRDSRSISCARIRNVVATIGPTAGKHLLLVSHYDSTPVGPGASDDGIGVASMLEVAALLRDRPLERPVTFLFNEGEESGLIGARAFLAHDPLAARVDSLINLESRGVNGPAVMFETSRPNGTAVAAYGRAVDRPAANSLTTDFYHLIPNSTDVAVFDERPWTILNFAVIGNETRYHSPGDSLAALDPRSVRHMGEQALALAAELANGGNPAAGSKLYADVLGRFLVSMPALLGFALLGGLILLYAWFGWRTRAGLGRASAAVGAALIGSGLACFAAQAALGLLRAGDYWRAYPEMLGMAVYATTIAVSVAALMWLGPRTGPHRLRIGFWLIFLLFGAAISLVAPGAAIFFLLPPLVAGAGMVLEPRLPGAERIGARAAWLLLFLSWAPLLHLMEVLLDFDAAWIFAPLAAIILLPVLIELRPRTGAIPRQVFAMGLLAVTLLGWIAVLLAPAYSLDRKQQLSVEYVWNDTGSKGQWMVFHDGGRLPASLAAAGPFERGVKVPWSSRKRWVAAAPPYPFDAPALERLGGRVTPEGRWLTFRLHSRGAEVVRLRAAPDAPLRAGGIGGPMRRFGKGDDKEEEFILRCHGRSCDGAEVRLLAGGPVELTIVGVRTGLFGPARAMIADRPATAVPQYSNDSTITVARIRL